jgi:glycosyltransferase involved in cell wall biosynthesis
VRNTQNDRDVCITVPRALPSRPLSRARREGCGPYAVRGGSPSSEKVSQQEHHEPGVALALVVPLQDEEATVEVLLRSIGAQTRAPAEVILVDSGSRDRTAELASAFSASFPLTVLSIERVFPGLARNAGVAAASEEWIAFTDGGIELDPRWLEELSRAIEPGVEAVFGSVEPTCDTYFKECAAIAYVPARDRMGARPPFIASSAVSRRAFEAVGGFPPYRAAEDLIFMEELKKRFRCRDAPRATVYWQIAGSASATFRRFAAYSFHNLVAGRGRHWHMGVARLYWLLLLAAGLGVLQGMGAWVSVLLPGFFVSRALKAAWVKRRSFAFPTLRASRVAGAAGVLMLIDAATVAGSFRWLRSKLAGTLPDSAAGNRSQP